jgi:hypothetical protein
VGSTHLSIYFFPLPFNFAKCTFAFVAIVLALIDQTNDKLNAFFFVSARDHLRKSRDEIVALCSKIHCPAETNPSWRWYCFFIYDSKVETMTFF